MLGKDPSPTALRSPLSPVERAKNHRGARPRARKNALSLSSGERGDRKAVDEGSFGQGIGGSAGGYLLPRNRFGGTDVLGETDVDISLGEYENRQNDHG